MGKYKLEMRNISMEFPGVKALDNVDFDLTSGEVRAVIGANGAGKSTLMKVLAGVNSGYTGDIYINGEHKEIRTPKDAKNLGIEIVYQEVDTALFPYLSVAENIMLNSIVNVDSNSVINWNHIRKSAKKIIDKLNIDVDPNTLVSKLSLAKKQMVLIARAVIEDCKFLILDEPTAPLSHLESEELFRIVRELSQQDVGIVFISHRLSELFDICNTFTVMKDGKVIANQQLDESVTTQDIVRFMLGSNFDEVFVKKEVPILEKVLEVENLCDIEGKVNNTSFYCRKGEVLGISGLVGAGKTELSKLLFGANRKSSGTMKYLGKEIDFKTPTCAVKNKIALIPEERRKEGILVDEPVYFNLSAASLDNHCKSIFIDRKSELKNARNFIDMIGIKTPSEYQKVKYLSGGNQQKVVIGKWLSADADIYIMDEPTKGIDIGAKKEVYELISSLVEKGKVVIYLSSEIQEILAITDRTYVMYNGEIVRELETKNTTEEEILFYSTGGNKKGEFVAKGGN